MKLKTKYLIYIALIHLLFITIAIIIFRYNKIFFLVCEFIVVISLVLSFKFYGVVFRPFRLLNAGIEAMSDKDFSMKFLPVGQPELDRLIEVYNKMIDQLRLERAKTTEKNFFLEKLIEASPAGIIILDKNKQIQVINPVAKEMLNLTSENNQILSIDYLPAPWKEEFLKLNESDSSFIQFNGIDQYKCHRSFFIDKGVKQSFFIIEKLTNEILKAEKQSYEKVIRMMSHEVNNSIGAVNSIIDSTLKFIQSKKDKRFTEHIDGLTIAKERNSHLNQFTKRFADIVKIPPPNKTECDLKDIMNHVLFCFQNQLEQNRINITTQIDYNNTTLLFDCQQLELVLINIIKNAIEAINQDGKIIIRFDGKLKTLSIENNGAPIPDNIQKTLFKPFFSTKKAGQGIGLTLIREILINHSCTFSLQTKADGITEFKIVFKPS